MNFDKFNLDQTFKEIKEQPGYPELFLEELFLIGKISENEGLIDEIEKILEKIVKPDFIKAYRRKLKIPISEDRSSYTKTMSALFSFAKTSENLDIGKIAVILGFDYIHIGNDSIGKKITETPNFLNRLNGIKSLYLSSTGSEITPEEIGNIRTLEELKIRGDYKNVPSTICKLVNLKKLRIEFYTLPELPKCIVELDNLEELRFSRISLRNIELKEIDEIPHWFCQLTQLKKLDILYLRNENIKHEHLPPNLVELSIVRMPLLKGIDDSLGILSSLKKLSVGVCDELSSLPYTIKNLTNLEEFGIGHLPKLTELDGSIMLIPNLRKFGLNNMDHLTIAQPERKVNLSKKLNVFNAHFLKIIVDFPELFPQLEDLYIYDLIVPNETTNGLGRLTNLRRLKILKITNPEVLLNDIALCNKLESLSISYSNLSKLPENFEQLQLSELYLEGDILSVNTNEIPASLKRVTLSVDFIEIGGKEREFEILRLYIKRLTNFNLLGEIVSAKNLLIRWNDESLIDGQTKLENLPDGIRNSDLLESFNFEGLLDTLEVNSKNLKYLEVEGLKGKLSNEKGYPIKNIVIGTDCNVLEQLNIQNYSGDFENIFQNNSNLKKIELTDIESSSKLPNISLPKLIELKLWCCNFTSLANLDCPSIVSLKIDFCKSFDNQSVQELISWKSLKHLKLHSTGIDLNTLTKELIKLELITLHIGWFRDERELPGFLGEFKYLKALCLHSLFLNTLPKEIANLHNLEYLDITSTYFLEKLPNDFTKLKLKELKYPLMSFGGGNMPKERYEVLITNGYTKHVHAFSDEALEVFQQGIEL